MSDESLVPVPKEEQLQKIDEAFEVERPDASIDVVESGTPEFIPYAEFEAAMLSVLAIEDMSEDIAIKKQNRLTGTKRSNTQIAMSIVAISVTAMSSVVAALCVILTGLGIMTLSDKVLLGLFALAALNPVLKTIKELLKPDNKEKQ